MKNLNLSCPDCGRALKKAPLYKASTTIVARKCEGCQARWSIILRVKATKAEFRRMSPSQAEISTNSPELISKHYPEWSRESETNDR